ncbi:MAG TPA: hypothetical protein VFW62_07895 [bacterium]|nr:hypothetical protein [bacterium]
MNWGAYSGTALWCLSLGLAALFCPVLGILGFVAVGLGLLELQNIKKGFSSPVNRNFARIGLLGGAIGALLSTAAACYLLFEGAREVRQFLIDATHSKWF